MTSDPTHSLTLRDGRAVLLRPARPGDAADLVVIQAQIIEENIANVGDDGATVEEFEHKLTDPPQGKLWLVAEHAGQVVGSVELHPMSRSFLRHLRTLAIELHRDWRGNGLGSAMIRHACAWARAEGVEVILLGVLDSNPRARALYERLGFQQIGRIPRLVKRPDGSYADDTEMALFLDQLDP